MRLWSFEVRPLVVVVRATSVVQAAVWILKLFQNTHRGLLIFFVGRWTNKNTHAQGCPVSKRRVSRLK